MKQTVLRFFLFVLVSFLVLGCGAKTPKPESLNMSETAQRIGIEISEYCVTNVPQVVDCEEVNALWKKAAKRSTGEIPTLFIYYLWDNQYKHFASSSVTGLSNFTSNQDEYMIFVNASKLYQRSVGDQVLIPSAMLATTIIELADGNSELTTQQTWYSDVQNANGSYLVAEYPDLFKPLPESLGIVDTFFAIDYGQRVEEGPVLDNLWIFAKECEVKVDDIGIGDCLPSVDGFQVRFIDIYTYKGVSVPIFQIDNGRKHHYSWNYVPDEEYYSILRIFPMRLSVYRSPVTIEQWWLDWNEDGSLKVVSNRQF